MSIMNKCLNCGKDVKNKYCNSKCRNEHSPTIYEPTLESINKYKEVIKNKWKTFDVKCSKCDKKFQIKEYNVETPKKEKYYCSRSCANTRCHTEESKLKTSNSITTLIKNGNAPGFLSNEYKSKSKIKFDKEIKICPVCNNEFELPHCHSYRIYCSKTCYLNDKHCNFRENGSGGMRIGSGRGKSGWYKGYWCDSSWELVWVIYNLDHNIIFERNKIGFEYVFNNKKYKFYPDFICNNEYYEIKGYIDEKNKCKISQFDKNLIIIDKKAIQPYIKYVIEKYGNNYIELYENNPHKLKNNKCIVCGEECIKLYCSRKCSGIGVSKSNKKQ